MLRCCALPRLMHEAVSLDRESLIAAHLCRTNIFSMDTRNASLTYAYPSVSFVLMPKIMANPHIHPHASFLQFLHCVVGSGKGIIVIYAGKRNVPKIRSVDVSLEEPGQLSVLVLSDLQIRELAEVE